MCTRVRAIKEKKRDAPNGHDIRKYSTKKTSLVSNLYNLTFHEYIYIFYSIYVYLLACRVSNSSHGRSIQPHIEAKDAPLQTVHVKEENKITETYCSRKYYVPLVCSDLESAIATFDAIACSLKQIKAVRI